MRLRVGLFLAALVVTAALGRLCRAQAFLKDEMPATPSANDQANDDVTLSPRYKQLLAKYLRCVDAMEKGEENSATQEYKQFLAEKRKKAEELAPREAEVLKNLLKRFRNAPVKLLTPRDYDDDDKAMIVVSAASARIFRKLCEADCADVDQLIERCTGDLPLDKEWIVYLQSIEEKTEKGSPREVAIALALYQAGVSREKYRPLLLARVEPNADYVCLDSVLFDVDHETGERHPVQSPENLALFRELSGKGCDPHLKVVCARYALATGDKALAESMCMEVLAMRYGDMTDPSSLATIDRWNVDTAKDAALSFAFYHLKNEKALKAVFDRTQIGKIGLTEIGFAAQMASEKTGSSFGENETYTAERLLKLLQQIPEAQK